MSWTLFKQAQWRLKPPLAPGLYPVAARDGGFRGYVWVYRAVNGLRYAIHNRVYGEASHAHVGFWWSLPVPPMKPVTTEEMDNVEEHEGY